MTAARLKVKHPPTPEEEEEEQEQRDVWEKASSLKAKKLEWLLPGRIPKGAFSILEGVKGASKSTLSAYLAACITTGKAPFKGKKAKPACVIWLPGEEDAERYIRPRLIAAGASLARVIFPPVDRRGIRCRLRFPADIDRLGNQISEYRAALVIIDPLSSHIATGFSLCSDQDIHAVLDPLADLSFSTGCTVIGNRNLTKNSRADKLDRGLGGSAVGGVARAVLTIDYPDRTNGRRLLRVTAGNVSQGVGPLEYHVESKGDWGFATSFKEVSEADEQADRPDDDDAEKDAQGDAYTMLVKMLQKEPKAAVDILKEAKSIDVSPRTVRTVKKQLKITSHRVIVAGKATWEWRKPEKGFPKPVVQ